MLKGGGPASRLEKGWWLTPPPPYRVWAGSGPNCFSKIWISREHIIHRSKGSMPRANGIKWEYEQNMHIRFLSGEVGIHGVSVYARATSPRRPTHTGTKLPILPPTLPWSVYVSRAPPRHSLRTDALTYRSTLPPPDTQYFIFFIIFLTEPKGGGANKCSNVKNKSLIFFQYYIFFQVWCAWIKNTYWKKSTHTHGFF